VPSYDPSAPAVVMLRRDWDFLFEQLKPTHAVVGFLERVVADPVALGDEPARYYQLALADHQADPSDIDPALVGGGRTVSAPLLPLVADPADWRPHLLVRAIFEDGLEPSTPSLPCSLWRVEPLRKERAVKSSTAWDSAEARGTR
jgi:hypothetical protein